MVDKDALFDELSKEFPTGKYTTFCNKMGVSYNVAMNMLMSKKDYTVALRELLSQWDLRIKGATRKQLEDALDGADIGGLCSIVKKHYEKASCSVVAAMVAEEAAVHDTRNHVINQSERSDSVHTNEEASCSMVADREMVAGDGAVPDTTNQFINQSERSDSVHNNQRASCSMVADTVMVTGDGAVPDTTNQVINRSDNLDSVHTNSEDISSKKISPSLTVKQCREKLENKYRSQLCKIQMTPWNQSDYAEFEDMHTVVTMVKKDARGQDTNKKEILKGSVADIFSTKVDGRLPARILISAPAGRGKTTAVAKMAYDWVRREEGSALEHLPLLFVVKFRNTSQLTSIGEAIVSQLLSDVDDLTPEGLESFIRKNQGICHIILDGLDEYAGISSSEGSSISNIVSVIRWKEFPQCRVLVTTRPHLENFFNKEELPRVYTKMWIEGFSRESSREYIDKFFASTSNPCSRHGLKVYLDDQPLINELVKTPLFCLMICHLWGEGLLDSGTATQTELFGNVNVFLMHHANARLKSRMKITLKRLRTVISQLGQVALTGLLADATKLVFTPHDFRKVPAILGMACELGIVSKTTVSSTCLPQSSETTSTTIEFYHKLAQEHSAGKFLADQTYHFMLRLKISKLDRVLIKIKANISDYENLIRFVAGTDNRLCIRIMEALLSNSILEDSERYRILLDCSSETTGAEGKVSSLVGRCVTARSMVLKSPTVYTVVGMKNLPTQLKREVKAVHFEGSTITNDVTNGLWSCLGLFSMLHTLTIADSSISFPPSPPELPSLTKLSAERMTSLCYEGVLLSIPGVREIDVSIDVAELEMNNTFQITAASQPLGQSRTREEQFYVHIRLHAWPEITTDRTIDSGESIGGLSLLFEDQTKNQHRLHVSGVSGRDEEALVDLFVKTKQLTSLNSGKICRSGGGSLNIARDAIQNIRLEIQQCQLSTEMTKRLWSCLRSFTSLKHLTISDSSLSFHPSNPDLPSVTKLSAERVTTQSYEGLLSSLPDLADIDITTDDAERDILEITACLRRTRRHQLTHIIITAPSSIPSKKNSVSRETMRKLGLLIREQTKTLQRLCLSGMKCTDEEDLVALVESSAYSKSLDSLHLQSLDCWSFDYDRQSDVQIKKCLLPTKMTARMWSCLRSFTTLKNLTISDSSLSFLPSSPNLTSVTRLSAERVTLQSYEGLLSSLPGLRDIDITIDDAERDIPQITACLIRTGGQQLTNITIIAPTSIPSEENRVSRETMRGLGLLIREQTKNLQWLCLSRVKGTDEKDLVKLVECCKHVKTMTNLILLGCGTDAHGRLRSRITGINKSVESLRVIALHNDGQLHVENSKLSTEMTEKLWCCLRSFTSLNHLTITDSSLSFPPSPPELISITKLIAKRVTSQSYEGLLSSLPGLRDIDFVIDDAETDITQITAGLRQTGGQQLTRIDLIALVSPLEKNSVSRETVRGLSLLIREQTKNLQRLGLHWVKCTDEQDLVYLLECCRHEKTMSIVLLLDCGTREGGRLESHLKGLASSSGKLCVTICHDNQESQEYYIPQN